MPLDLKELARRVDELLPNPVARATQLAALADSLVYIQTRNPEIWLVHMLSDRIRLFAGRLIVLTLQDNNLWVTTDVSGSSRDLSVLHSWAWDTQSYPRYRRPPSQNGVYSPLQDRNRDWASIQKAHFGYLDRVLTRYRIVDPRSAARHEPFITEYLSIVLRRSIPGAEAMLLPVAVSDAADFWEGSTTRVPVNRFERDRRAREECLHLHGRNCAICGMSFGDRYGPEVEGFIHVHHVIPLAEIRKEYSINPINDLVPVCPNCHAVLHAAGSVVRSVEDVRKMLRSQHETG